MEQQEQENNHTVASATADLLYVLVAVDRFLVKHDKTPLARQLRAATDRMMSGLE